MSFEYGDFTISVLNDGKLKIDRKFGEADPPLAIQGSPEEKALAIGRGLLNRRDISDLSNFTSKFSEWLSQQSITEPIVEVTEVEKPSVKVNEVEHPSVKETEVEQPPDKETEVVESSEESPTTTDVNSLNDLIGKNISVITPGPKGPTSTKGVLINEDKDFVIVKVEKGGLFGGKDKKKIVFYSKQSILGVQFE